jgi:uncharacterized repeat protein (TIGR01451 family)
MSILSKFNPLFRQFALILLFAPLFLQAQNVSQYSSEVAVKYYKLSLELIKTTPGFSPPVASRALGYTGLTLYEAMVPGIPSYQSSDGILNGLGPGAITDPSTAPYHYPTVANNALALIIDSLYANTTAANKTLLNNLRDSLNTVYQGQTTAAIYNNSLAFGQAVANDVFNFSRTDGGHKGYTANFPASYVPPTGAGLWEPTPTAYQSIPLQPYWGNNRPIVPASNSTLICPPPPTHDTTVGSAFYNYANQVYTTVNNAVSTEQTIALYWADGGGTATPPGHSISILTQLITTNNDNLEFATLSYAKLSMAVMDAFINCWATKYTYNLLRPVTYIRTNIDANWLPLIATPPFPEYSSGHSSQSGAFAAVMTGIYGPTYSFTDNTHGSNFGGPRTYSSFKAAADEAAISRLYGGIHYEFGNEAGKDAGTQVGTKINELFATQLRLSPTADVAIDAQFDVSQATLNDTVTLTIYLVNQGLTELNNVSIASLLPANLQYISDTTNLGSYNSNTGLWTISQVPAGTAAVELVITAKVIADGVPHITAELITMDESDADSAPNNQDYSEDDIQGTCISVPIRICEIGYLLEAPAGYSSYQWYQSSDNGQTFVPIATTPSINITTAGQYTFTVDGAILGSCGNQSCCPVIVEQVCCPTPACIPLVVNKR